MVEVAWEAILPNLHLLDLQHQQTGTEEPQAEELQAVVEEVMGAILLFLHLIVHHQTRHLLRHPYSVSRKGRGENTVPIYRWPVRPQASMALESKG